MATKIVTARLMIREAARALEQQRPETVGYCSMAKLHGTDAAFEVRLEIWRRMREVFHALGSQPSATNVWWLWSALRLCRAAVSARYTRPSDHRRHERSHAHGDREGCVCCVQVIWIVILFVLCTGLELLPLSNNICSDNRTFYQSYFFLSQRTAMNLSLSGLYRL